jgi:hypothetical protein
MSEQLLHELAEIDRDVCDERDNAETLEAHDALDAAIGHLREAINLIASTTIDD